MPTEVQNTYDTDILLRDSGAIRAGQRLTISNRQVTSVSFYLKKIGTPPSTGGYITIYSLADVVLATVTISDAEIQALGTSYSLFTKSITATIINEEVRMIVGINSNSSWTVSNCIAVGYQNSDIKASEYFTYGMGWTNATTQDCAYQYVYNDLTTGTVTTQAVTAISGTTATGNGNITSLGIPTATQHGGCWNTTGTPTTADSKTENGVPAATGAFTSAITGLTAGTKYYFRPYITNSQGTAYGSEVIFWADKGTVYPSEPLARVTNLIHRYDSRQSVNQLEISLGDITSVLTPLFMESPARATADKQKAQDSTPIIDTAVDEATSKAIVALKNYWSRQIPPYSANVTALQPAPKIPTVKELGLTQEEVAKIANQPGIVELLKQLGKR